ncbi:phage antirepressor KilAC domain-containing protein [Dehalobacter sp. DCM]|uniref:phage antirepressor KilAC domain-containing protein n=1 Tax=Dehalobacter sp. DCM TaxID=2907827 RepID=UPI00308185E5|nr:phage antirepressor KilAC domain-containing protein [Dehalobacter sp. DCM]
MSNDLIKIEITDEGGQAVSTRELHEKLGINGDYTSWFKYQSQKLSLEEGKDFTSIFMESTGGRPSVDFIVPIDIAKHLCMVSGGEKAHAFREYFIQVERAWNSPEQVMARALQIADKRIHNLQLVIEQQKPKVDFFDAVADSKSAIEMSQAAKVLSFGKGRNTLFKILREEGILRDNNEPYQEYIDRGYFRVVEQKFKKPSGETEISIKTLVYQRGLDYIRKIIDKRKSA